MCILSHTILYYTILFDTILYYSITMCRAPEDWVGAARRYECQFDAASSTVEIQPTGEGIACELMLGTLNWVLVSEFGLSYHTKETIVFTIDPYFGNLH